MGPIDRIRDAPTFTRFDLIADLRLLDLNGVGSCRREGIKPFGLALATSPSAGLEQVTRTTPNLTTFTA